MYTHTHCTHTHVCVYTHTHTHVCVYTHRHTSRIQSYKTDKLQGKKFLIKEWDSVKEFGSKTKFMPSLCVALSPHTRTAKLLKS